MGRTLRGWAIPSALLVAWELGSRAGILPEDSTSRPSAIARAAVDGFRDGSIPLATWQTLEAALLGFAIAAVLGVGIGILLGLVPRLERTVRPTVDALRPIPSVALIPLALLLFGFGLRLEASVVAFASFWPILLMTISAVREVEPRLLEVARTMGFDAADRVRKFVLPAALGRIVVGLRLALAIALVVAVTVEIVLNPRGLGSTMMAAQQAMRSDIMYAQLLWLGCVGWGLNALTRRAVRLWPGAAEGTQP
jgi:NitT/TauT family transport system permease protein